MGLYVCIFLIILVYEVVIWKNVSKTNNIFAPVSSNAIVAKF